MIKKMSKIIKDFEVEKILGSGLNAIAYLVSKKLSDTHKDFYVIKRKIKGIIARNKAMISIKVIKIS